MSGNTYPAPLTNCMGFWLRPFGENSQSNGFQKASVKACAKLASCTTREFSRKKALRSRDLLLEILFQSVCGGAWASPFFRIASDAFIFSHHTNSRWEYLGRDSKNFTNGRYDGFQVKCLSSWHGCGHVQEMTKCPHLFCSTINCSSLHSQT